MRKDTRRRLSFYLAVMTAAVFCTGCGNNSAEQKEPAADETAAAGAVQTTEELPAETDPVQPVTELPAVHAFAASTLDGTQFTQEDVALADVTVINIWQTTCGPCILEMPELAELEASLPENVRFVTWCLDATDDLELTQFILDECGFEGTTLIGAEGDLYTMLYQVMYTPTTVFLDSEGNHIIPELIGSPEDPAAAYREAINTALRTIGKEALSA